MQYSNIIGKVAQRSIYTKYGTPLISKSQKITPALAAVAERWHVLDQLWNAVKETPSCSIQCQDDELIRAALGYPVKHQVSDQQGNIILEVGELVTYCAVERAKQAHVLNRLLSFVYTK